MAGFILILNHFPARDSRWCYLVIQRDCRPRQIVKQRLKLFMKQTKPMLYTLVFAPGTYRFVQRIIAAPNAKLYAVILPKAGDGRGIQNNFRDRRKFDCIQFLSGALRSGIKAPRTI